MARMTKFPFFPADGQLVRVLEITLLGALVLVNADSLQQNSRPLHQLIYFPNAKVAALNPPKGASSH